MCNTFWTLNSEKHSYKVANAIVIHINMDFQHQQKNLLRQDEKAPHQTTSKVCYENTLIFKTNGLKKIKKN